LRKKTETSQVRKGKTQKAKVTRKRIPKAVTLPLKKKGKEKLDQETVRKKRRIRLQSKEKKGGGDGRKEGVNAFQK